MPRSLHHTASWHAARLIAAGTPQMAYMPSERILFSSKFFSAHVASPDDHTEQVRAGLWLSTLPDSGWAHHRGALAEHTTGGTLA